MTTLSTLLRQSRVDKRKFIDDQSDEKDSNNSTSVEERKMKSTRPEQPSSLWTCSSKIFGGCQETKEADTVLREKKIPYWKDVETCNLNCGIPGDLIDVIGTQFSGGKSASSLRSTTSALKDLEKGQEEKNEQHLLQLLDQYFSSDELYEEKKINFRESQSMKKDAMDLMKEMFKLGQGKDFYNLVLKKVLTRGVFNSLRVYNFSKLESLITK
jgi:hypothetical protein